MAGESSRTFSASEVLAFLEGEEDFEDELSERSFLVDLDGESDDDDKAEGDGNWSDSSQVLVDTEIVTPDSGALISLVLNSPAPAERDSMLLQDTDLCALGDCVCVCVCVCVCDYMHGD